MSVGRRAGSVSPARALELMAVGAGLVLVCTLAGAMGSWRAELGRLQALLLVGFAFLGVALVRLPRWRDLPYAGVAVFVVALSMRLAVLPVVPTLSDDVWRYVWDGRVAVHGIDPWAHAPSDPALAALRDAEVHPRVNHPALRTIYPPLAEAGFALVARVHPGLGGVKTWIVLHDLALVAVLAAWCARRTGSALPAIAYAWNPLVVCEYAGNAHHDPTGMLWLVLALAWLEERPLASAAAFGTAVLVKLAPLALLPLLVLRWPWRARILAAVLLVAGLGYYLMRATGPASGLGAYVSTWGNNASVFSLVAAWLGDGRARLVAAGAVAVVAMVSARPGGDAPMRARGVLRAGLLAGPVLHPWYMGWALALEPLAPSAPWLLLSATVLLGYGVFAPPSEAGAFHLGRLGRVAEYGLPLALAAGLAIVRMRGRTRDA
jgi:hypothetical protein